MKTVTAFESYDGTLFADADACRQYEINARFSTLANHVDINCHTTFIDDWQADVIEPNDVAHYIMYNWDYLMSVVTPHRHLNLVPIDGE